MTTEADQTELSREIDIHNESQEKTVARVHDLVKALLVLSGGALAVCASFFSTGINFYQLHRIITPIQTAWVSLTVSIAAFATCTLLLIGRDYQFGELRGEYLRTRKDHGELSKWWDRAIWGAGLFASTCFSVGMAAFCWAAWLYLQAQR